jgi:hypothetical protein
VDWDLAEIKSVAEQTELRGADGLRLMADVDGPIDGPPALLLHGLGKSRQSWGLAAAKLGIQGFGSRKLN